MGPRPGHAVLALSALGYPLTQLAIRSLGRRGALLVEAACGGLLARDMAMLASGAPRRLRRGPGLLLWCEAVVATAAVLLGVGLLVDQDRATGRPLQVKRSEVLRRGAVCLLFGLHTVRFWVYLQPDRGRRPPASNPPAA